MIHHVLNLPDPELSKDWREWARVLRSGILLHEAQENSVDPRSILTANVAVDALGLKTFSVSLSLSKTPELETISLTLMKVTNVADYTIGFLRVDAASATQIDGSLLVTLASLTVGAVVKVGVLVVPK